MTRNWHHAFDESKQLILETKIEDRYIRVAQNGVTEVYRNGLLTHRWHHDGLYDELRFRQTRKARQ